MKVVVSKSELMKFRRRALKAYPNEKIELVWGKMVGRSTFHVYLFDQIKHLRGKNWCQSDEVDHEISVQEAQAQGLVVLGTIHTHPNRDDCQPSEPDFDGALEAGEVISGICAVWECKKTGKMKTRIRFWGPIIGVTVDYV